jgi:hypothetical protein
MSVAGKALRSQVSQAWSCATVLMLAATFFAWQTNEVSAETFDFTFSGIFGSATGSITGGLITVDAINNSVTSVSGTAYGMSSVFPDGRFTFSSFYGTSYSYTYVSSTNYEFNIMSAAPEWQTLYLTDHGSASRRSDGSVPYFAGTSVVTSSSLAAPEIDGSVVPRAAFVMMGLFWIFKSRQRRLRLAEA